MLYNLAVTQQYTLKARSTTRQLTPGVAWQTWHAHSPAPSSNNLACIPSNTAYAQSPCSLPEGVCTCSKRHTHTWSTVGMVVWLWNYCYSFHTARKPLGRLSLATHHASQCIISHGGPSHAGQHLGFHAGWLVLVLLIPILVLFVIIRRHCWWKEGCRLCGRSLLFH